MKQDAVPTDTVRRFFTTERLFLLVFLVAFILRLWQLDLKLLHHDEAIHSWFCYELLTKGAWQYDPSYHGPFLYFVTTGIFALIGPSDFAARLLPSLFGLAIIPLVYALYRIGYLGRNQMLLAALLIAVSPDLVYFSRFLRHDIFMLFFTMLFLVAVLYWFERGQTRFAIIAAVAAACALSCKEEMPVFILVFLVFFAFEVRKGRLALPAPWRTDLLLSALIVVGIMCTLYSAFFVHPDTLIGTNFSVTAQGVHFEKNTTGWYQAADHWLAMHNEQRLGGPAYFYLPLFLLYELPVFILAIIGTLQFMTQGLQPAFFIRRVKNWIRTRNFSLPVEDLAAATLQQIRDRTAAQQKPEELYRLCIVWMIAAVAFYAWVGEKVPWLIIPQVLPMCIVATYHLNWQKTAFALAGCIFLVVMTWHVAFVPADISEPIVQVQNSEDLREVMRLMDHSDRVVIASKHNWPLPWYYRGDVWDRKITFYDRVVGIDTLTANDHGVIILYDGESYPSIPGYTRKTWKLMYWFSFNDNQNRLPEYYLRRDGKMGSTDIDVFTRDSPSAGSRIPVSPP